MLHPRYQADTTLPIAQTRHKVAEQADISLHCPEEIAVSLHDRQSPCRQRLEDFIREKYWSIHAAKITHFMPTIMSLNNRKGELLATCGLRRANEEDLFLEHYLDVSIEQALQDSTGQAVARASIFEIGNFAVRRHHDIRTLLSCISRHLHETATEWAVFTATTTLYNSLQKLTIPMVTLGEARLEKLPPDARNGWGTYYDCAPKVLAIARNRSAS